MRQYLVIANLTLGGDALWREVRERLDDGPCSFHVLVPATHQALGGAWTEDEARQRAATRLVHALEELERLGAEADGEVGDIRTIDATLDALRERDYDEIIISTLPRNASRWLGMDLVSRMRRATLVPITHVIGEPDPAG